MRRKEDKTKEKKIDKKESDLITKESLCAVCALFSVVVFFILCTRASVFGDIGFAVHSLFVGLFGYLAYPLVLGALYASVTGLIGVRLIKNRKATSVLIATLVCAALVVHTALTYKWELNGYIANCFRAGETFPNSTASGWVGGILVWGAAKLTTKIGAIVIFSLLTAFFGYLTYILLRKGAKTTKENVEGVPENTSQETPIEIPLTSPDVQAVQTQETAFGQAAPQEPFADVMQRPAFTLPDENNGAQTSNASSQGGGAFSPFGTMQSMQQDAPMPQANGYESRKEFLFSIDPAENFKRNLIFDKTANVNRRSNAAPQPTTVERESCPSYVDAYQNSINNDQVSRPPMVFGNTQESNIMRESPITPLSPLPTPPLTKQEPASYPDLGIETPKSEPSYDYVEEVQEIKPSFVSEREEVTPRHDYMNLFSPNNPNVFGNSEEDRAFAQQTFSRDTQAEENEDIRDERTSFDEETSRDFRDEEEQPRRGLHIFDSEERMPARDDLYSLRSEEAPRTEETFSRSFEERDTRGFEERDTRGFEERDTRFEMQERNTRFEESIETPIAPPSQPVKAQPPTPPAPPKPRVIRPYVRVPIDDFDCRDVEPSQDPREVEETKETIIATLEDFKVSGASIASVTFGPTVTRYNVTIPRNISPRKVVSLDQSIAISLHSSGVNVYPNYEDGVVSIEVPNKERQFVQLGCMLTGNTFVNASSSSLMFTMGKDVANRKVYGDISKMTHLLVAGSSGSGKSVFLGSLIISLIYKYSPEELRLILIDPKKTEFVLYNNLPHLMINEILTDVNKSVQSLNWAIGEMNRRYGLFEQMSRSGTYVVNLDQYNAQLKKEERLPKIVIIIDELADLMLAAKKDIEDRIQNLTQKARAAGIHLVVATQRPSTDVITGVIKSNLATRIAFAVATDVDSRVILDQSGAQKLLGKGDFLYTMQGINTPVRVQSAFISAEDSQKVVNFIKANNEAYYDENATAFINNARGGSGGGDSFGGNDEVEPVYIDALRYVILSDSASISMIQRKCSVGYNKAGKIVEWMEEMGYISSFDGAKARKVLISKEEFESKYGSL